jgi:hypothetical protein
LPHDEATDSNGAPELVDKTASMPGFLSLRLSGQFVICPESVETTLIFDTRRGTVNGERQVNAGMTFGTVTVRKLFGEKKLVHISAELRLTL